jgi:LuxR family maltose regulon positive regulatory protein
MTVERKSSEPGAAVGPTVEPPVDEAAAEGIDAFSAAIVRGKVRTPALRPNTLERPRLLNWLEEHAGQRVRVLTAEAGYGKTTLIADHVKRSGRRAAWIRLEAADTDWVGMLSYVVASFRELIPDFGVGAVNLLQRVGVLNATRDMVLDMILAELERTVAEPLTLILDDFHAVQDGEDVRAIVNRLIELAPPALHFVISGRRHPGPFLARASSQGQVVEIGTQDLRFTWSEAGHLLANILGEPLDDDLVRILDERLAGWGASLQLVGTSLVGLRPGEVRVFIEELTSRSEPLYDFLAEQVLRRQPPAMRRVLSVASILERIEPTLLLAAMAGEAGASSRRVATTLAQAEEAGILSRTSTSGRWWRFHPLVRDFMLSRHLENTSREALLGMHLRVAEAAEQIDWAVAAHHYIEGERPDDAMRVLRESAIEALGTASWGAATALADRMPEQPVPEAVTVLRAYALVASGRPRRAVRLLEGLEPDQADPVAWGLRRAALLNAYLITGQLDGVERVLVEMSGVRGISPVLASLARGTSTILAAHHGGPLADASETLEDLARDHARLGLTYFAGVSYHNAALAAQARGQYENAVSLGNRAVEQFNRTPSRHGIESTHAMIAVALCELGQYSRAAGHLECLATSDKTLADAQADAAWIAAAEGNTTHAWLLIEQAAAATLEGGHTPGSIAAVQYSRALAYLVDFEVGSARRVLAANEGSLELDALARHASMEALVAVLSGNQDEALRLAEDGLAVADRQGASHWIRWLRFLTGVARADGQEVRRSVIHLAASAKLSTLILADVVVTGLGLMGDVPSELLALMRAWPGRWLPVLRRAAQGSDRETATMAAGLLSTLGTVEDVPILSAFERKYIRQPARRTLSRKLARHANPTMVVHDLGRIRLQLGSRVVPLSQSRRKAASLLAYLASRPSHSATRDQVLEAMWPNQSPEGAANSLHQTLYFLRRDIDPWFDEGHSVDYLVVEPDVVYLDPELVQVDSAAFFRQVSAALASDNLTEVAIPILRDYEARFALDFEYEEWSLAWRDQLHGLFLETTQAAADALLASARPQPATDILQRALAIDPSALELEATLVRSLHASGATAAAAHQYHHFAKAYEEETGDQAPSLETVSRPAQR